VGAAASPPATVTVVTLLSELDELLPASVRSTTEGEPRSISSSTVSPPEAEAPFGSAVSKDCSFFLRLFRRFLLTETCYPGTAVSGDGCEAEDGHEAETDSLTGCHSRASCWLSRKSA